MGIFSKKGPNSKVTSVHPHTHGDFYYIILLDKLIYGSPPHAWGF